MQKDDKNKYFIQSSTAAAELKYRQTNLFSIFQRLETFAYNILSTYKQSVSQKYIILHVTQKDDQSSIEAFRSAAAVVHSPSTAATRRARMAPVGQPRLCYGVRQPVAAAADSCGLGSSSSRHSGRLGCTAAMCSGSSLGGCAAGSSALGSSASFIHSFFSCFAAAQPSPSCCLR